MTDLAGGHYPQAFGMQAIPWGGATNVANASVPPRSNLEYLGYSTMTNGAIASTGVSFVVPVPVDIGSTISAVTVFIGATAASLPTHQFAALYSGNAGVSGQTLIGQSTDGGSAPIAASAAYKFTLTTPQTLSGASTSAPNGWVYVAVCITATTMPTALGIATPTAAQYAYFTGSPTYVSATSGSAQAATAAALSMTAAAVAPIVVLT